MSVILVTGGNRGIGYGTVEVLAKQIPDATILVGCRSAAKAAEPIAKLKQKGVKATIEPLEITITDDSSIRSAVDQVTKKYGRLDGKYGEFLSCQATLQRQVKLTRTT